MEPNLTDERAAERGATLVGKPELFADRRRPVDPAPGPAERTRGLIGAGDRRRCGRPPCFVNTSRGPPRRRGGAARALRDGRIAGAGLDVFEVEPLPPDVSLLALPNVVLTPHLGDVTAEGYAVFYREALEDILAWDAGRPVRLLA